MAKEELKQMINRVTIQGTLMDNNIEIKVENWKSVSLCYGKQCRNLLWRKRNK